MLSASPVLARASEARSVATIRESTATSPVLASNETQATTQPVTTLAGQSQTSAIPSTALNPISKDSLGRWIVPLARAGAASTIELSTADDPVSVDLPVPAGYRAVELRGVFEPRGESTATGLEATSGVRGFKVDSSNRAPTPFVFTLEGLQAPKTADGTIGISLALRTPNSDVSPDCQGAVRDPAVARDLVLVLAGNPVAPPTIAEFLPTVMNRVLIDVPTPINPKAAEAALKLTARLVAKYGGQSLSVEIRNTDFKRTTPPEPFTRHFRIVTNAAPSLRLVRERDTVLELKGSGEDLARDADFIGSSAFTTSFTNEVLFGNRGKVTTTTVPNGKSVNLDQLRRNLGAQGVNRARLRFVARQADVGGPIVRMTFKLHGRVVAIIGPARKATVRVSANGRPLARADVALGDGFELEGAIEPQVVKRDNEVVVDADAILESAGSQAGCSSAVIRLELDSNSIVSSEPGKAVAAGFDRFPQAFHDGFDVALSPLGVAQLGAAANIVAGLQEQAQPILIPTVVSWPTSSPRRPTLLVGGSVAQVTALRPPMVPGPLTIEAGRGKVGGGTEPRSVTALEAFENQGIDQLLLASSRGPSDLGKLAASMRNLPGAWTQLTGDVYLAADGETRMARLRPDERVPIPEGASKTSTPKRSPFLAILGGGGLSLLGLGLWVGLLQSYRRIRRTN